MTNPQPLPKCPRYRSLDLWRGIACLSVVVFHSTYYASHHAARSNGSIASAIISATTFLWVGVPVFFVISGYCITATIDSARRRPNAIGSYFFRRFRRIYPPYWYLILAVVAAIMLFDACGAKNILADPAESSYSPSQLTGSQWFGNLTLTETWRHHCIGDNKNFLLGHAWTLCYEEQFYFVAGALLLLAPWRFFGAATAITCLVLGLHCLAPWLGMSDSIEGFFFDGSWLMFAAGILMYYRVNYCMRRWQSAVVYAIFIVGIALTASSVYCYWPVSGENKIFVALCFALVCTALHPSDERLASAKVLQPILYCGTMCYSLYLVHAPIARAVSHFLYQCGFRDDVSTLLVTLPICTALSISAGILFFMSIESRFLNSRTNNDNNAPDRGHRGLRIPAKTPCRLTDIKTYLNTASLRENSATSFSCTMTRRIDMNPTKDGFELVCGVLNTSIASENIGDVIIMDAAARQIDECLPLARKIHLTTHEKLSWTSLRLEKKVAFNIACGTNLLHSHMEIVRQWNIGFVTSWFMKPVILLGVGWRAQAKRKTTLYTKLLLRSILSRDFMHSVRDSYTERRLREIGIRNVINTSCPSMWSLTPDHCAEIPSHRGEEVVMTLTDYSRDPTYDRQLLEVLKKTYKRVHLWLQGTNDYAYFTSIASPDEVHILSSSLRDYDDLLANQSLSLDYVGTRLHGGIRALQHKRRALIIGVDHRALEKGHDFNLPVVNRYIPAAELEYAIRSDMPCEIHLPMDNILRWKAQFDSSIVVDGNTFGFSKQGQRLSCNEMQLDAAIP